VGDGGTHPGGATLVRAERMMTWRRSTDAEVLRPAPVALEFLRRGKSAAMVAQKMARSGGGMGTSADQRPRWRGGARGVLRRENGGGKKWGAAASGGTIFKWHSGEQRKGGGGVRGRWHGATRGRRGMRGGLVPTGGRRDVVQTGERRGPLTHGPQPTAGGRRIGEKRGAWAGPGKKGNGPSPREQEDF
jgi:hypothetical protein